MKNKIRLFIIALLALGSISSPAVIVLQPVTTFGPHGDGSLRADDVFFLTSSNQWQRGMAYNPTTGHLLVVDRSTNTATSGNNDVYILDGATGAHLGQLDNSFTLDGGNTGFRMNLVGVGDDGAIYAGNLTSSDNPPQFRLYRWADESSPKTLVYPTQSFPDADPSSGNTNSTQRRWGDTMTVRGSGLNTQILIANRGNLVALFTPDDASYSHFSAKTLTTDANSGDFSIGLTFGDGNTFWGTSGGFGNGPLRRMSFNAANGTATTLQVFPSPSFPGSISPILVIPSSNLLAGLTTTAGPDIVRLYDISNPANPPVFLDRKPFPTSRNNSNFAGSLAYGTNGVLYVLDGDNGIMAFNITDSPSNSIPPAFYSNPANASVVAGTNSATFTAGADSSSPIESYEWFYSSTNQTNLIVGTTGNSLTLSNVQVTDAGGYFVVASNSLGMATSSVATLTVLLSPNENALVYDPFPYAVGTQIAQHAGWFSSVMNNGFITNGTLSVPGLKDSAPEMLSIGSATISIRRDIGSILTEGSVYFSYALRIESLGNPTANTIGGFVQTDTSTYFVNKINIKGNGAGGYNIGVFKGGGETAGAYAPNNLAVGDVVFIVNRYTFNPATGTDDVCDLWINPDPSTFGGSNAPPATVANVVGNNDIPSITRVFFRNVGAPLQSYVDEVRVGTSWADVTPVSVPLPVLGVTRSGSETVMLTWPSASLGFALQSTASLTQPITWSNVTNSVVVTGDGNTVTIKANTGAQFYRLRK